MKVRFDFNYVALYDSNNDCWKVYEKLDKRIPKSVACYGSRCLGTGPTADEAIADAVKEKKVDRWSVQVIKDV